MKEESRAAPVLRFERTADGIWHAAAKSAEETITTVAMSLQEARIALEELLRQKKTTAAD